MYQSDPASPSVRWGQGGLACDPPQFDIVGLIPEELFIKGAISFSLLVYTFDSILSIELIPKHYYYIINFPKSNQTRILNSQYNKPQHNHHCSRQVNDSSPLHLKLSLSSFSLLLHNLVPGRTTCPGSGSLS
ncbi:hypothetical protein VNO78_08756 [Psophocarpus tetragonolobus]|uniref:Uncharacterized protein n=1 Tax=Psophocarpus tetragonolobus TaxID=3891 RepID=A0AAN9SVJ6_PSOTE